MKYSLQEIRKVQKGRGFYLKISNEIASYIVYKTQQLNIQPNHITLFSFIFGILFFFTIINSHFLLAVLSINLLYLFDNLDGQLARIKKLSSPFGAFLDSLIDGWNITLVVTGIGVYLYNDTHSIIYLYITLSFFILSFLDFALNTNISREFPETKDHDNNKDGEDIPLKQRYHKLRPLINIVDAATLYDKWIFIITVSLIFKVVWLSLYYMVLVRFTHYSVKLFKLLLLFK